MNLNERIDAWVASEWPGHPEFLRASLADEVRDYLAGNPVQSTTRAARDAARFLRRQAWDIAAAELETVTPPSLEACAEYEFFASAYNEGRPTAMELGGLPVHLLDLVGLLLDERDFAAGAVKP